MPPARSILITGASSGIGRELAYSYAAPGIHLALTGRNKDRLAESVAHCRALGAAVTEAALDVRMHEQLAAWIRSIDRHHPIDLAIACAGITAGCNFGRLREDPEAARAVIASNLVGAINTVDPVVERMCMRGHGHVAMVGSIGALRGLPYCPAYSASKAGVHAYAEGLRSVVAAQGIRITIIAPGFVETPLNRDIVCPKPLLMSAARAVRVIRRGLDRGAPMIIFPRLLYWGALLSRLLPRKWVDRILAAIKVDIPEYVDVELE
jgi:short-subunit dehydrogenase